MAYWDKANYEETRVKLTLRLWIKQKKINSSLQELFWVTAVELKPTGDLVIECTDNIMEQIKKYVTNLKEFHNI